MRIVRQILDRMPDGRLPDPGQEGHAAAAGPHRRVDGGADPPLQDLHRGVQGARGRGVRRRSRARAARSAATSCPTARPSRTGCTSGRPSFVNLQSPAAHDARRPGRRRASPSSPRSTPSSARSDRMMARLTDANVLDRPGDHRPLPAAEVGAHPAAAPRPGAGRPRHRRRHGPHRRAARRHAGRGVRHGHVLRDVQVRAGRPLLRQRLHEHLLPARSARGSCSSTPRSASASRPAAPPPTACSRSRTSSASPPAPRRRPSR